MAVPANQPDSPGHHMVGGPGAPQSPPKPKKTSAAKKLKQVKDSKKHATPAVAKLALSQLELMGSDVDIETFKLKMSAGIGIDISECLTAASVDRTIEGASTLEVTMLDRDKKLLQSSRLHSRNDVEIDGLYFRLVKVSKS